MKKEVYTSPEIEVVEVVVEQGFAATTPTTKSAQSASVSFEEEEEEF